jgi:demethylmenaquinone methyltransferase/2-methoxy-6-polyprenyl-1,4-benzoquinol methylase
LTDLAKAPARIEGMFDAIAKRYDFLNHFLSAGIDRRWRRQAIAALKLTGRERLLDLCTGTADLAIAAVSASPSARHVVGVDFAAAMLAIGREKLRSRNLLRTVRLVRGDATCVPLAHGSVDVVTAAFGIRNVENTSAAFAEMHRVLAPGGRFAILEFANPTAPGIRTLYRWYSSHVLPRVGAWLSRHNDAYGYLPASIRGFASPEELVRLLQSSGFTDVLARPLSFGIVYLYTGRRR